MVGRVLWILWLCAGKADFAPIPSTVSLSAAAPAGERMSRNRKTVADIRREESDAAADYVAAAAARLPDTEDPALMRARVVAIADGLRTRLHGKDIPAKKARKQKNG